MLVNRLWCSFFDFNGNTNHVHLRFQILLWQPNMVIDTVFFFSWQRQDVNWVLQSKIMLYQTYQFSYHWFVLYWKIPLLFDIIKDTRYLLEYRQPKFICFFQHLIISYNTFCTWLIIRDHRSNIEIMHYPFWLGHINLKNFFYLFFWKHK